MPIISSGGADYIAAYVTNTNQRLQANVLVVNWVNNIPGAVFGPAVSRNTDLKRAPNAVKYLIVQFS